MSITDVQYDQNYRHTTVDFYALGPARNVHCLPSLPQPWVAAPRFFFTSMQTFRRPNTIILAMAVASGLRSKARTLCFKANLFKGGR